MPSALIIQDASHREATFTKEHLERIGQITHLKHPPISPSDLEASREHLEQMEVLVTGWGAPSLDQILPHAQHLKLVLYAGGAASSIIRPDLWSRGILLSSAYVANAQPVAEFTLAAAIFGLKKSWFAARSYREIRKSTWPEGIIGSYKSRIGLLSFGAIARKVVELARPFDWEIDVWDPYLDPDSIVAQGAHPSEIRRIFAECDVVSLHSPEFPETRGMIGHSLLASLKPNATFINTARGALVDESALIEVARSRPDLQFVLDVTYPEPPAPSSELFQLDNIFLTPHIAGSIGNEQFRMGEYMIAELERYVCGRPLQHLVSPENAKHTTHRPSFLSP